MIVSEKQGPHGLLLVITDSDLVGKKFEEGNLQLDLTKGFYEGSEKSKEEIKGIIHKARDLHFTGKEAIAVGLELNLIDPDKILYVDSIPHAEVVL